MRRRDPVQPVEHLRLPDLPAHLRVPGELKRDGARDPDERQPPDDPDREPAERVEKLQRRQQAQPAPDRCLARNLAKSWNAAMPMSAPASPTSAV